MDKSQLGLKTPVYEVKQDIVQADSLRDVFGYVNRCVEDLKELERAVFNIELKQVL